jgi:hypothetical protein
MLITLRRVIRMTISSFIGATELIANTAFYLKQGYRFGNAVNLARKTIPMRGGR